MFSSSGFQTTFDIIYGFINPAVLLPVVIFLDDSSSFASCHLSFRTLPNVQFHKQKSTLARDLLPLFTGLNNLFVVRTVKCKGKGVSLQGWSGPEDSRKLRLPDFVTTAQDGGKVVSLTHRQPLPPGNTPGTHFC